MALVFKIQDPLYTIMSVFLADNYVLLQANDVHFACLSPSPKLLLLGYKNARARNDSSSG